MERKHLHAREFRRGNHSTGHGVRNVVEFQVEEDRNAKARKLSDGLRAFGGKECAADFEEVSHAAQLPSQLEGWPQAVNVQRDD
jgi:hypothetical protein